MNQAMASLNDENFRRVLANNPIVYAAYQCHRHGDCSEVEFLKMAVVALADQNAALLSRVTDQFRRLPPPPFPPVGYSPRPKMS